MGGKKRSESDDSLYVACFEGKKRNTKKIEGKTTVRQELQQWEPLVEKICIRRIRVSCWLSRQWFVVMGPRVMAVCWIIG